MSYHQIFSYGSNSLSQLRARCENLELKSRPAYLDGYVRIFSGISTTWTGGIASIHAHPGGKCYGSLVTLSDNELEKLTFFETGYSPIILSVFDITHRSLVNAIAFIKDNSEYVSLPSEAYLMAIYCHLNEHFDPSECSVCITSMDSGVICEREEWVPKHPLSLSLQAIIVQINNHPKKTNLWVMPRTIEQIVEKLNRYSLP